MLVSAMNPCPCVYTSDLKKERTCSSSAVSPSIVAIDAAPEFGLADLA